MDCIEYLLKMDALTTALVVFLLLFGAYISYLDVKTQKIKNVHVLLILIVALTYHVLLLFFGKSLGLSENITPLALNAFIAFVVAFAMYLARLWAAADAKFYFALVLCLPLFFYRKVDVDFYPSIALLINAYIAAFFVILAEFLLNFAKTASRFLREIKADDSFKRQEKVYGLLQRLWGAVPQFVVMGVGIAFIMVLMRVIMVKTYDFTGEYFRLKPMTMFLILFLLFNPIYRLMRIKWVFGLVLFALVTWVIYALAKERDPQKVKDLLNIGYMSISLIMFREIYNRWQSGIEGELIKLEELDNRKLFSQKTQTQFVAQNIFTEDELVDMGIDALTDDELEKIKQNYKNEDAPGFIEVQRTIPFGPFLYFGLLGTIITQGIIFKLQWLM